MEFTENSNNLLPEDNILAEKMFYYFIGNNQIDAFYNGLVASKEDVLKEDVYIKIQDLKNHIQINALFSQARF